MSKEVIKSIVFILIVIVGINLSMWLFNHASAWAGLVAIVTLSIAIILYIINNLKEEENEKK